jgi:hypothetical protein
MTTIHGLKTSCAALLDYTIGYIAEMLAVLEARGYVRRPGRSGGRNPTITLTNREWPPTAASTTSTVQHLTGSLRT